MNSDILLGAIGDSPAKIKRVEVRAPFAPVSSGWEDRVLHLDRESGAVKQSAEIVVWEIRGLYDSRGRVKSRFALRANPPALKISSDTGKEAVLTMTKEMANILGKQCADLHGAYYGIRPSSELTLSERKDTFIESLKKNKAKAGIAIAAVLCAGILMIASVF